MAEAWVNRVLVLSAARVNVTDYFTEMLTEVIIRQLLFGSIVKTHIVEKYLTCLLPPFNVKIFIRNGRFEKTCLEEVLLILTFSQGRKGKKGFWWWLSDFQRSLRKILNFCQNLAKHPNTNSLPRNSGLTRGDILYVRRRQWITHWRKRRCKRPLLSPPPLPHPERTLVDLLHLNISIHILHTVIFIFPTVMARRICFTIRTFLHWRSLPFYSWHLHLIQGCYCEEKLEANHSEGFKGSLTIHSYCCTANCLSNPITGLDRHFIDACFVVYVVHLALPSQ